jgi:toxin-antitoxin system PIN domain toxin
MMAESMGRGRVKAKQQRVARQLKYQTGGGSDLDRLRTELAFGTDTVLLDANVLVALLVDDHVLHDAAENWFTGLSGNFATCPITQGSLMRLLIREGQPASAARNLLSGISAHPRHEFWADTVPYADVPTQGIVGHRQLTGAYLAQLARVRGGRLATFDQATAKLHHDVADLVPDNC